MTGLSCGGTDLSKLTSGNPVSQSELAKVISRTLCILHPLFCTNCSFFSFWQATRNGNKIPNVLSRAQHFTQWKWTTFLRKISLTCWNFFKQRDWRWKFCECSDVLPNMEGIWAHVASLKQWRVNIPMRNREASVTKAFLVKILIVFLKRQKWKGEVLLVFSQTNADWGFNQVSNSVIKM